MTPDERAPEALCTFGIPFPPKTTEHTDAPRIALVQERALQAHANAADGDPEANATMPAHSPVGWAQDYARLNREAMMASVFGALNGSLPEWSVVETAVHCHHNYVTKEHHFGANVWLTRKGAVRARQGDLGIIPGSMGARSFIVRGKGNAESFHSCSHGAGRAMSRKAAKFTLLLHVDVNIGAAIGK